MRTVILAVWTLLCITCQDLLACKEDYVADIVGIKKGLRERMVKSQRPFKSLNNEKLTLEEEELGGEKSKM